MAIKKISIIGSGNVAEALCRFFKKAGLDIHEIHSRNATSGKKLAKSSKSNFQNDIEKLNFHAGLFILAVPDDVIKKTAARLPEKIRDGAKVVHCSGSTLSTVLKKHCKSFGVFYPLQTFTKGRKISARKIPFCITASNDRFGKELFKLAEKLSTSVQFISDKERKQLHLGAVMVNNFTNHLFSLSADFVEKNGLSFDMLGPLIEETVKKGLSNDPRFSQTGPAKRGDKKTIESHLKMLKKQPNLQKLYQQFSKNIFDFYKSKS